MATDSTDAQSAEAWLPQALCASVIASGEETADIWFANDYSDEAALAAAYCFNCPVRLQCLKASCEQREDAGVWGGLPVSIRTRKGQLHRFTRLSKLGDPYSTFDEDSPYFVGNLTEEPYE